jgi:hypothetical protein
LIGFARQQALAHGRYDDIQITLASTPTNSGAQQSFQSGQEKHARFLTGFAHEGKFFLQQSFSER